MPIDAVGTEASVGEVSVMTDVPIAAEVSNVVGVVDGLNVSDAIDDGNFVSFDDCNVAVISDDVDVGVIVVNSFVAPVGDDDVIFFVDVDNVVGIADNGNVLGSVVGCNVAVVPNDVNVVSLLVMGSFDGSVNVGNFVLMVVDIIFGIEVDNVGMTGNAAALDSVAADKTVIFS